MALPVASGGVVHGALRITLDASRVDQRIRRFWTGLAAIAAVILALSALIGWALARSLTRPVRHLNVLALRFAGGDLTAPDDAPSGPPELRDLATTLTTMAVHLANLIEAQRAFVADASHQLRTPLTALRLRLENLRSHSQGADAAELDAIIDESSRLAALVTDLLHLARADQHPEPIEVDLTALAAERVDIWSAIADTQGVRLAWDGPPGPVWARAVPGSVEQIFDNVLDNALNVSPSGSTVTVSVSVAPGDRRVHLGVSDEGPGLSDGNKQAATGRFWRADASTPGTGLGLAIAVALAEASGGTLELSDAPDGGLTVSLELSSSERLR